MPSVICVPPSLASCSRGKGEATAPAVAPCGGGAGAGLGLAVELEVTAEVAATRNDEVLVPTPQLQKELIAALKAAGVTVVPSPAGMGEAMHQIFKERKMV